MSTVYSHLGRYIDREFERDLYAYFQSRLPENIFDAHLHVCPLGPHSKVHVDVAEDVAYWRGFMKDIVGEGRMKGGLMLPHIFPREEVDFGNDYAVMQALNDPGSTAAILVTRDQDPEKVEQFILANPIVTTLKPYLTYSTNPVKLHSDIEEFVPDWAWALADRYRLSVTLHIARYLQGLSDPKTMRTVIEVCERYPNMRLILAHCALAHNPDTLKKALPQVRRLENLYFDTSGITEPAAICHTLDGFGPGKMLYGSDLPFGSTLGRIVQLGSGLLGLDPQFDYLKPDFPMDYDCSFIPNAAEGLITLFTALDEYGISREGQEAIFYNNARWVFRLDGVKGRPQRARADEYDREERGREDLSTAIMAKGCQVWSEHCIPFIDTCSDGLGDAPLGYSDTYVAAAIKEAAVAGLPKGFRWKEEEELKRLLLADHPWAGCVILTESRAAAEALCEGIAGRKEILGGEIANGATIGAILCEEVVECDHAQPDSGAVKAAIYTQKNKASLHCVRDAVCRIWKDAQAKYGVPASISEEELSFDMAEADLAFFKTHMQELGFIASNRFVPTAAHIPSVLKRYEAACHETFAAIAKGAQNG